MLRPKIEQSFFLQKKPHNHGFAKIYFNSELPQLSLLLTTDDLPYLRNAGAIFNEWCTLINRNQTIELNAKDKKAIAFILNEILKQDIYAIKANEEALSFLKKQLDDLKQEIDISSTSLKFNLNRLNNLPGFDYIEFDLNQKPPILVFGLQNNDENSDYLEEYLPGLYDWATVKENNNNVEFHLKSKRDINLVLAQFLYSQEDKSGRYKHPSNNWCLTLLEQRFQGMLRDYYSHDEKRLPAKKILIEDLILAEKINTESNNLVFNARKRNALDPNLSFFKELKNDKETLIKASKISEVESFAAFGFRLLIGEGRAPDMVPVVDKKNRRKGTLASGIANFISATDYYAKDEQGKLKHIPDQQFLIEHGITEVMIATYFFMDIDAHTDNWGFNNKEQISRIDFDHALINKSARYHNFGPYQDMLRGNTFYASASEVFPVTEENIIHFPNFTSGFPYNWFTYSPELAQALNGIEKNPDFIKQKWKFFLKSILIPTPTTSSAAQILFGSVKSKQEYAEWVINRVETFKQVLLRIEEFRDYLTSDDAKQAFSEMMNEYECCNKAEDPALKIDNQLIQSQFSSLLAEIKVNKLGRI